MSEKIKNVRYALVAMLLFFCAAVQAQTVKGVVKDATGEPIIGATIMEKGTKNAAVTDFDGNFSIKMSSTSHALTISYIGMVTQEVKPGSKTELDIVLEDDNSNLEEVVVVGYTSKARKDLTGSVGSISGAKLAVVPVASAAVALQGKVAGVQVTTTDGAPGADVKIRVRGATSVTQENEPLYIVDGFEAKNINDIPPSDIASIDILKDASLTAIYGAKGGNGVVVVTTKSAQQGKVSVTFNGRLSVSHVSKQLDLMNSVQFMDYTWDRAAANSTYGSDSQQDFRYMFGNQNDLDLYNRFASYDWQDEVMGSSPISYQANVTVGGGNEKTRFNVSLTQSDDPGIIKGSGVRRTNLNVKLNTKIGNNLNFSMNPKVTYRRDTGSSTYKIPDMLRYQPVQGIREFAKWDTKIEDELTANAFTLSSPLSSLENDVRLNHAYNYTNQFALDWTPIAGLVLKTSFTHSMGFSDKNTFYSATSSNAQNKLPVASIQDQKSESYTWTNTASYSMDIKQDHNLSFLLGQEMHDSQYKRTDMQNRYFPFDITASKAWDNMNLGENQTATTFKSTPDRMASFFGQVSYNYKHKYLASVTMRADGSTKFAPGYQWGYFPSVSGAWVISDEAFMKDVKWINQLKLRAAFGLAGNNRIDADLYRYLYTIAANGGPGFGEGATGTLGSGYYAAPGTKNYPNEKIKWETTTTRNIALDIQMFNNRLKLSPELYLNTTKDLLYQSAIPSVTGYTYQMQNIGEVENKGVELTASYDILQGKDYVLTVNATLGHNVMKVKKLNAEDKVIYSNSGQWKSSLGSDYLLEVGSEVGLMYGFVYDGLYTFDDFKWDAAKSYHALPWGSTAADNGIMDVELREDGYKTVIIGDDILADNQAGDATMPGKIKLKDRDGDGYITEADRTVIGRTTPRLQGGFGLSGQWKDFDFSANFTYMLDFDVYNATRYALSSASSKSKDYNNVLAEFANNRWRYVDPSEAGRNENLYKNTYIDGAFNMYKQMNSNVGRWNPADLVTNQMISNFVEDGSFLRLSDITIGYTLPKNIVKKIGVSKVRAYVSGSNLFIITGYSGYDPEVDIASGLNPNMDYNRYPRSRTFSFGLNVSF